MSVLVIPESDNEVQQLMDADAGANEQPAADVRISDDRANIPVSEITERFLRAILVKVPLDRIEELHLFSPLRQGTVETGIAVVAARVILPDEPAVPELELQLEAAPDANHDTSEMPVMFAEEVDAESSVELEVEAITAGVDELLGEVEEELAAEVVNPASIDGTSDSLVDGTVETTVEVIAAYTDHDSPYADEPLNSNTDEYAAQLHELAPDVAEDELPAEEFVPRVRHTVYTARYRLVIKGPERGRWEMDVVDEADAPLLAIESVVRGVQRRAGEETATVRYDAAQLARALRITAVELP